MSPASQFRVRSPVPCMPCLDNKRHRIAQVKSENDSDVQLWLSCAARCPIGDLFGVDFGHDSGGFFVRYTWRVCVGHFKTGDSRIDDFDFENLHRVSDFCGMGRDTARLFNRSKKISRSNAGRSDRRYSDGPASLSCRAQSSHFVSFDARRLAARIVVARWCRISCDLSLAGHCSGPVFGLMCFCGKNHEGSF